MDRFIDTHQTRNSDTQKDLKSSMDRFIVIAIIAPKIARPNLKSSMDRFIANICFNYFKFLWAFKIQYG